MITNIPDNSTAFLRVEIATSKKILLAIAAAAACTSIVVLAPELAHKSEMAATQAGKFSATQAVVVMKEKGESDGGCSQHWPYYEQSCLRDARLPNGVERVVRVIAIGRAGEHLNNPKRIGRG